MTYCQRALEHRLTVDNLRLIVIGHQTVSITHPLHPSADLPEHVEERLSILLAQVDIRPVIAPGGDMVQSTRKLYAQWSSHKDQRKNVLMQDLTPS